jgi:hypothetical protein
MAELAGTHGRISLLMSAIAVLSFATAGSSFAAEAPSPWTVVASPSPSSQSNYLDAVDAVSATDAWAVGAAVRNSTTSTPGTLTEHWNGTRWRYVPSPNATDGYNELFGVEARSSRNVWAVGYSNIALYGSERSLIEHWNGSAWRIVPSPNIGQNANILYDIASVTGSNMWAVGLGNSTSLQSGRPLIQHWNGTAWSLIPSPNLGTGFAELRGVTAVSASDIWAVGRKGTHTLVEHFDGTSWTVITSPDGADGPSVLYAVDAVSANDVWAVGSAGNSVLVEHWNGSTWQVVAAPNGSQPHSALFDIVALSATDLIAVGFTVDPLLVNNRTLTERFNGAAWSIVPSPNPSSEYNASTGVDGLPGGDVWAVGNADEETLVLRAADPG